MAIDWDLATKIAVPLGTLVLGKFLDQLLLRKARLISYLGHVLTFMLNDPNRTRVFTHSIVVRNTGRVSANNVRVGHYVLPDHQFFPPVAYSVQHTPTGESEILIPKLVPAEQVTISYLYFPPLTWDRINAYTKCDEGLAKIITVIPTPQPPRWLMAALWGLVFVGATTLIYLVVKWIVSLT